MPDGNGQPNAGAPQQTSVPDIYRDYNFKLLLSGTSGGHFTQCSGIGIKVNPIAYREGGNAQIVHQLAGPVEYSPIILRYGLTDSAELWQWMQKAIDGRPERKNVSIVMLKADGQDGVRWDLEFAWPMEWRAAPLDAMGREVAIESLCLVYERLNRS